MDEQKHLMSEDVGAFGGKAAAMSYPFKEGLYFSTAAALSKTAVAPIDRLKLLIQNQNGMMAEARLSKPYKGMSCCFSRIIMEEGFGSLWRGNTANVIRYVPAQAINFGLWDFFKTRFREIGFDKDQDGYFLWCFGNVAAGTFAGCASSAFVYPMEYARMRLAIDTKTGGGWQYRGLGDLCRKTWAANGISGFHRGFILSFVGTGVYRGLYFGMYECLKPVVLTDKMQDSFLGRFGLAWASATAASSSTYQVDTFRRRITMMSGKSQSLEASMVQFAKETVSYSATFSGVGANIPRAIIGATFGGVGANIPRAIVGAALLAAYDGASSPSLTN